MEIEKAIKSHDNSVDVEIYQVGGQKMGSFEISCNGHVLFSKLSLGYFPYVPSATTRIMSFIEDYRKGNDLKKYS
jgi:selT/selW/selH-like putative selenoprotein